MTIIKKLKYIYISIEYDDYISFADINDMLTKYPSFKTIYQWNKRNDDFYATKIELEESDAEEFLEEMEAYDSGDRSVLIRVA